LDAVAMLFVAVLLISNTIAVKVITIGPFDIAAGIICFPIAYVFGDVLTEVYGYAKTRRIIWFGFACLALMSVMYGIAVQLPPAGFWTNQEGFSSTLGFAPRIACASFAAYIVGSFANSVVMSWMKLKTGGRYLWMRTIGSTIVGEGIDSIIFNVAAWAFIFSWTEIMALIVSGFLLKTAYEVIATPLTYLIVGALKKVEGVDPFDHHVSYNPFSLK